jgi:4-hydroxy-tetrahydrodipicolinate synthase
MSLFKGSGVALVTPFKDGEVNYDMLEALILWHIQEKTDAIIVFGTTGESATLAMDEKKNIVKFAVEVAKHRIPIIAGSGSNNTKDSILLSQYAESVGADGLLLVTPYYNKPTQRGLYAHFKAIAESVSIPIILYNVPSRTGINLLPETVAELAQIKHIEAIKEASGDISQIAKVIELCPKGFITYSGNDDQTIPVLALGGQGVISVTANIIPRKVHDVVMHYLEGSKEAIQEAHDLRALHQAMFIESNPVPVKTALNLMGQPVGTVRLPLVEMELKSLLQLKAVLEQYHLIGEKS